MSIGGQELFNLLPAYYRLKDTQLAQSRNLLNAAETALLETLQSATPPLSAENQAQLAALTAKAARGPLQSLMMLIAEQVAAVEEDLNQLYDDEFIETCAPWVIPYIGDLIGYQSVHGIASSVASPRAEVANTISFRRRKGTILVIEQLARDVTGWGAHAVEFFKLLSDTQNMNHLRLDNCYAPDLRGWQTLAYMETGFDATAHTVDVRRIAAERGRYNIQNIGIFLWSLNAYPLANSPCVAVPAPGSGGSSSPCFRFSTLGRDMPIFNFPVSQGSDITAAAGPSNVADCLTRNVLCQDIQSGAGAVYYGGGKSLALYVDGALLSPYQIQVCDLSGDDGAWINAPTAGPYAAAVDPALGRISLPPPASGSAAPTVEASFCYGFNGDMGGGPYPRNDQTTNQFAVQPDTNPPVSQYGQGSTGTLLEALGAAISGISGGGEAALEITDNGVYELIPGTTSGGATVPLALRIPAGATFEFRAAEGCRPTIVLGGELQVAGGALSSLYINGLVFTYAPPAGGGAPPKSLLHATAVATNHLGNLNLAHCTFVPGWALNSDGTPQAAYFGKPTVIAETPGLTVQISKSILGTVWVNGQVTASISDSIIDATDPTGVAYVASTTPKGQNPKPGGPLSLSGCTVVGKVYSSLLTLVTNSLVWAGLSEADMAGTPPSWSAPLWACQQQNGCVRFSFIPSASIVPRQYECVVEGGGSPQPIFASLKYGDPGYGKLPADTDDLIRRGADDGGEMGGFHFILAPLRETDLRTRIQEYIPVNLDFGIFYQT